MSNLSVASLTAINNRITTGLTVAIALLYQAPVVASPFTMLSAGSGETVCTFSTSLAFKVISGARVTISNPGTNNFVTNMFMLPVAGQPLQFRLSLTQGGAALAVGSALGSSATVQEKPLNVDVDSLAQLVLYEANSPGMARQTASFGSSVAVALTSKSVTTQLTFSNAGSVSVGVSHVLTIVGGNSTFQSTVSTYHGLSLTTVQSLSAGDSLAITANQIVSRTV